jgi:5-methylcytosine-specific restriction protein B
MLPLALEEAIGKWDRAEGARVTKLAEAERAEVLKRFPLVDWPTMPLERYAVGQADAHDTFCRRIEFQTPNLGSIKGGSARKLLIYKHRDEPGWYFRDGYRDEQEAWKAVRGAFAQAFELAAQSRFPDIDAIEPLRGGPALRVKATFVYFPDQLLPICSRDDMDHFRSLLGGGPSIVGSVTSNHELLELVRRRPEFEGWSTYEIGAFLYSWANPHQARRIVKIAPGEQARYWDDCRTNGYICVGWDEIADLTEFDSKDDFKARFADVYRTNYNGSPQAISKKANELWTLRELEPGDVVIANKGISRVLAVGKVIEPGYEFRTERSEYKHTVSVAWDESFARDIEPQKGWINTVDKVSQELYRTIAAGKGASPLPAVPPSALFTDIEAALDRKRQVILYGPPGTGKTYEARRFAVWWLTKRNGGDADAMLGDRAELGRAEATLSTPSARGSSDVAQLSRVTFHPSYAYEDFVEGYKPAPTGRGGLELNLQSGIFKRVCLAAQRDSRAHLMIIDEINRGNVPKIFGELVTLLEADKRGLTVTLPQSGEAFTVPDNVYLIGTMNTADRSIRLLDAALRRRFAFIELMPNPDLLAGATVGSLALDDFLTALNQRIARAAGRDKQVGHSLFLQDGQAITTVVEFARRFRQDLLPLLQEYAYDDYRQLEAYLGPKLIDADGQMLKEALDTPDALIEALSEEYRAGSRSD